MKTLLTKFNMFVAAALAAGTAMATPFGSNITIDDKNDDGTATGWYGKHEDQEVETNPTTVTQQQWDLEGMFLYGNSLSLVGGYDFKNGVTWTDGHNYKSGDIFIDVNGDAVYGQTANGASGTVSSAGATTTNAFGYDYVVDLDFTTGKYSVYALTATSIVSRGSDVASSNPWTYVSGGTQVLGYQNLSFTQISGLTNAFTGFKGDTQDPTFYTTFGGYAAMASDQHYSLSVDVGFLSGKDATFHYTMECGNDNLMGHAHVPETGATALLFGLALAGLAGIRRKLVR